MERLFRIEEVLAYIHEQKKQNATLTRQLSLYYEATQKNLEPNEQTLELWTGYIDLLQKNGYSHLEIREVYKMLKSTFWRFLTFWNSWLEYESLLPPDLSKKSKLLEVAQDILQYKECKEKENILQWIASVSINTSQSFSSPTKTFPSPEHPRSTSFVASRYPYSSSECSPQDMFDPFQIENIANTYRKPNTAQLTHQITGTLFDSSIDTRPHSMKGSSVHVVPEDQRKESSSSSPNQSLNQKKITLNGKKLRILRVIGKGGSAKVYQVLSEKNEVFALKKIKLPQGRENEEIHNTYVNEIKLLKRLRDRPEIVTLIDSYINRDRIAILMEYGDIDLNKFLEIERKHCPNGYRSSKENYTMITIWEQMLRAVKCIHEHRIVHRDLKPANFLFVNGHVKLIDFGISKEIRNDTTNIIREKQIGTINYMSPEAITEGKTKMGRSSDIWSLGCILYEMYFGESPFMRFMNFVQRMQKLLDPEYEIEYFPEEESDNRYSEVVAEIKKCLRKDPKERATIDSLLEEGISSRKTKNDIYCSFTKDSLLSFVLKIMEIKQNTPTKEARERIAEKITDLYFSEETKQQYPS
ncbi:serine/threonine-protein kinase TTK/MPS1 [Nematocida sp. LUAm3]|nr:serine/threonine-protein kinase TTK/MPS1 [Nematocida sp. LUAm3]KAI5176319.1 serine/threonine-protein kinase TTK/MPS1 [Nematocida sp. LUAm2]KAI5178250.1 serine/threonine-protein kinase TTK/MPS1 [Nematocida sp. LUAm1]